MSRFSCLSVGVLLLCVGILESRAETRTADVAPLIQQIKQVGPRGEGHAAAQAALKQLGQSEASALIAILEGCDGANPLARNWLVGAFEAIADRTRSSGGSLPADDFEAFVRERSHDPHVRRLVYEWLVRIDETAPDRLIPEMLDDPSGELRRDAVARLITAAEQFTNSGQQEQARTTWDQALQGAVDQDQVDIIVAALKDLGRDVDRIEHFGFVMDWSLVGPFDNKDMSGFDVAYPPEQELDFDAEYPGQIGPVRWKTFASEKEDGMFDIAELVGPHKGAIMYATTVFDSPKEQEIEFRLATQNAWKMWLNGELLFAREEYHRGKRFDQYRVRARLKAGENRILLKVLQNEQDQEWAQEWAFHFRVCDFSGRAISETGDRRAASAP